jgi:hypothetical protein
MTTMQRFHEYASQPRDVIEAMRFGEWDRAKSFVEGEITFLQALEASRNERAEVRRELGWGLK